MIGLESTSNKDDSNKQPTYEPSVTPVPISSSHTSISYLNSASSSPISFTNNSPPSNNGWASNMASKCVSASNSCALAMGELNKSNSIIATTDKAKCFRLIIKPLLILEYLYLWESFIVKVQTYLEFYFQYTQIFSGYNDFHSFFTFFVKHFGFLEKIIPIELGQFIGYSAIFSF